MIELHKTDIEYEGIGLSVEYEYDPPIRGHRAPGGLQMEPDWGPEISIVSVTFQDQSGIDHELLEIGFMSNSVINWVEGQCYAERERDVAA